MLEARPGKATLKMAYFFSGVKRKASIAEQLKRRCAKQGLGLIIFEIDVLVGGYEHDLLNKESQEAWLARVEDGEFDIVVLPPPCGSGSKANWANDDGPKPCRDRAQPWGCPSQKAHQQRRADAGNEFIHFSIGAIRRAQLARSKGFVVRAVLEDPEDLGRMDKGELASIWQLPEVRTAFGDTPFASVAGHQCQFPRVDRKKPTRLLTDILTFKDFGHVGLPKFDARGYYLGPLPRVCGHNHR